MGVLIDQINELKKELKAQDNSLVTLSETGIEIYDIYSGGGLPRGGFVEFVGNPGTGKTTIALQILGNIYRNNKNCIIVIFDAERSITDQRLRTFGLDPDTCIIIQTGLTVEKIFQERIEKIIEYKEANKMIDIPVYILWDSVAHTPSEKEIEVTDINSAIGVKAKVLNAMLRKYDEYFMHYNITMLAINQLTANVKMGPQYVKTVSLKGLGDRTVPGGTVQYYTAFHFVLWERSTDLTGSEFGFKGYIVEGTFIKNKSGIPFEKFYSVIDYKNGIHNFWTKFLYLKDAKVFKVNGGWYTLEGYVDENNKLKKFRGSSVKEKYETDPEFKRVFDHYWDSLKEKLIEMLSTKYQTDAPVVEEETETVENSSETVNNEETTNNS